MNVDDYAEMRDKQIVDAFSSVGLDFMDMSAFHGWFQYVAPSYMKILKDTPELMGWLIGKLGLLRRDPEMYEALEKDPEMSFSISRGFEAYIADIRAYPKLFNREGAWGMPNLGIQLDDQALAVFYEYILELDNDKASYWGKVHGYDDGILGQKRLPVSVADELIAKFGDSLYSLLYQERYSEEKLRTLATPSISNKHADYVNFSNPYLSDEVFVELFHKLCASSIMLHLRHMDTSVERFDFMITDMMANYKNSYGQFGLPLLAQSPFLPMHLAERIYDFNPAMRQIPYSKKNASIVFRDEESIKLASIAGKAGRNIVDTFTTAEQLDKYAEIVPYSMGGSYALSNKHASEALVEKMMMESAHTGGLMTFTISNKIEDDTFRQQIRLDYAEDNAWSLKAEYVGYQKFYGHAEKSEYLARLRAFLRKNGMEDAINLPLSWNMNTLDLIISQKIHKSSAVNV